MSLFLKAFAKGYRRIKSIGYTPAMDAYEKRRLAIFNTINFIGLITGIILPVAALFGEGYVPPLAMFVAASPMIISGVVLYANYRHWYSFAMMWYFICYPLITALVYAGNIDVGIELLFILYAVLAVFFLQRLTLIAVTIFISICCYCFVYIIHRDYQYVLADINYPYYFMNQLLTLVFIFAGLFLIKKENSEYQKEMLLSNWELKNTNLEIQEQRVELGQKAELLELQTMQLSELNSVKNRLFSIISHDLKTPIYGLRNLFKSMHQYDLPAEEIKVLVPDILNDLNYTTELMENLLQWAKSQMQGDSVNQQLIDITSLMSDVKQLLRLQAENKKVYVTARSDKPIYIYADKDMINLVLLNLMSNAIKFTPEHGEVSVSAEVREETVEVFIKDTGIGITKENMGKLFGEAYFSTKGTANEAGTGLGLKLCKEFLVKNGGDIFVKSEPGKGSVFSFTLPKA